LGASLPRNWKLRLTDKSVKRCSKRNTVPADMSVAPLLGPPIIGSPVHRRRALLGGEHVLAEAGARVLRVKRVDQ
jgi:hypothetical protein